MEADLELSVCIVTYRRPPALARLLRSLERQAGELPAFEVLVVDNDAEGSVASICAEFEARLPLRYVIEPRRGISHARNRSVQASRGRYLAFLDDDHEVGPDWLATLYAASIESGADGVFGPVRTRIEGELPMWVRDIGFFDYPPATVGAAIPWYWTRTANACIRRAALPDAAPFDASLALIGGEDVDLFARMARRGASLIAVGAPAIQHMRPLARANASWMIRRSFRNGGTIAHVKWRALGRRAQTRRALAALGEAAAHLLRAPFDLGQSRSAAFVRILSSAEALGKAAWVFGVVYAEYRRPS